MGIQIVSLANPFLTSSFADEVEARIDELSDEEQAALKTVPGSLEEALDALEEDHDFLLKGGVFTQDVLDVWIEFKRQQIDEINLRPHPYEFHLYFDM